MSMFASELVMIAAAVTKATDKDLHADKQRITGEESRRIILRVIQKLGAASAAQITDETSLTRASVGHHLMKMVDSGVIRSFNGKSLRMYEIRKTPKRGEVGHD